VHPICCGLDLHKKMVSASIIITVPDGEQIFVVKEFSTLTDDLYRLKSWLSSYACPIVAMESTSVYWRPVHNVLEDTFNESQTSWFQSGAIGVELKPHIEVDTLETFNIKTDSLHVKRL